MIRDLAKYLIILSASCITQYAWSQEILIPAMRNGVWGYTDIDSKWVIEPAFSEAKGFTEGLAAVSVFNKWGFINHKGEWIIEPQFEMAIPFSENLAAVIFDNRWGFVDHKGSFVIDPVFHKVSSFSEGLALASNSDGYFFITNKGYPIGQEKFKWALPFAEGMAPIILNSNKGYIDSNGFLAIKHQFEMASPFSEGLAQVRDKGHWGFIDRSGNILIPLEFASSTHFSEGLAAVAKKNKWGFIDKNGDWAIKADYEQASPFNQGLAIVKFKGSYGAINKNGNWVVKPEFEELGQPGSARSLKDKLATIIEESFSDWVVKGEFEKTEDYIDRTGPQNQEQVLKEISNKVIKNHGDNTLDYENAELGLYNADQEAFHVFIPGTLPTRIEVPITEALWFKENWREGTFENTEYKLAGENLILSSYTFLLKDKSYRYLMKDEDGYFYNYASISWEEEISVPEINWNIGGAQEILRALPGTSDVDNNIPIVNIRNGKTFALIIGNEDYSSSQTGLNNEIDVSYAAIDAEIFSKYANKTLGIPRENIVLIKNGTAGQIRQALAKMNSIAEAFDGQAEFIFYYAGHGLPDETTGKPYLIPVDVNGADLSFAISLEEALNILTEHKHQRITVFLDACFTGGGRNGGLIAARGVKIKPKSPFVKGNLLLFAASSGNQSAFSYKEKAHGMFTYYLLKKLQETNGNVTYFELSRYLEDKVRKSAIIYNNKEQNPELILSPSMQDAWEELRLNSGMRKQTTPVNTP